MNHKLLALGSAFGHVILGMWFWEGQISKPRRYSWTLAQGGHCCCTWGHCFSESYFPVLPRIDRGPRVSWYPLCNVWSPSLHVWQSSLPEEVEGGGSLAQENLPFWFSTIVGVTVQLACCPGISSCLAWPAVPLWGWTAEVHGTLSSTRLAEPHLQQHPPLLSDGCKQENKFLIPQQRWAFI